MIRNGDRLEETITTSWFARIKKTVVGILIGGIFFIGSFVLLIWNEKQAVDTSKALIEGREIVQSSPSSIIDPKYQDKLLHTSGFATTTEILRDPSFNVTSMTPAIKLKRMVEMYQWQENVESEKAHSIGGSTTDKHIYTYTKEWSSTPINSNSFKNTEGHQNPTKWEYKSRSWQAKNVQLGAYKLSADQVADMNEFHDLEITSVNFPEALKSRVQILEDSYFLGNDVQNPEVGDLKISYALIEPQMITVVAKQVGDTFEPYQTKSGGTVSLLEEGEHSAAFMFAEALSDNAMIAWVLRLAGFLCMWLGLVLIFNLLVVITDFVPFLGSIAKFGVGFLAGLLALSLSLMTIAIAWLSFRPILGGLLLLLGLGIIFALKYYREHKLTLAVSSTKSKGD